MDDAIQMNRIRYIGKCPIRVWNMCLQCVKIHDPINCRP
jgi:hypothetical protein